MGVGNVDGQTEVTLTKVLILIGIVFINLVVGNRSGIELNYIGDVYVDIFVDVEISEEVHLEVEIEISRWIDVYKNIVSMVLKTVLFIVENLACISIISVVFVLHWSDIAMDDVDLVNYVENISNWEIDVKNFATNWVGIIVIDMVQLAAPFIHITRERNSKEVKVLSPLDYIEVLIKVVSNHVIQNDKNTKELTVNIDLDNRVVIMGVLKTCHDGKEGNDLMNEDEVIRDLALVDKVGNVVVDIKEIITWVYEKNLEVPKEMFQDVAVHSYDPN